MISAVSTARMISVVVLRFEGYLKVSFRDGDNYSNIFVSVRDRLYWPLWQVIVKNHFRNKFYMKKL